MPEVPSKHAQLKPESSLTSRPLARAPDFMIQAERLDGKNGASEILRAKHAYCASETKENEGQWPECVSSRCVWYRWNFIFLFFRSTKFPELEENFLFSRESFSSADLWLDQKAAAGHAAESTCSAVLKKKFSPVIFRSVPSSRPFYEVITGVFVEEARTVYSLIYASQR